MAESKNKNATVVIGAGFGDEGKGLMTDYFAAKNPSNTIVARFNGGAQAGHTVVTPEGTRHVHSHIGSGTLAGAATYLSRFFVSNPILFFKEIAELENKKIPVPEIFVDDRSLVTTPYDMLINRFVEESRGANKHGSCGVGFGETIERCRHFEFSIVVGDLAEPDNLLEKLCRIPAVWLPRRLKELGIDFLTAEQMEILYDTDLKKKFIESANQFYEKVGWIPHPRSLRDFSCVIFEAAQGLMLDQTSEFFPHVTRSSTGLKNALALAEIAGFESLDAVYITRAYATRHGAGHLPHEDLGLNFAQIEDATNVANKYQGRMRHAPLDLNLLAEFVEGDFRYHAAGTNIVINPQLAVTCLDQIKDKAEYFFRRKHCRSNVDEFLFNMEIATGINDVYESRGPTRETILLKKTEIFTKAGIL